MATVMATRDVRLRRHKAVTSSIIYDVISIYDVIMDQTSSDIERVMMPALRGPTRCIGIVINCNKMVQLIVRAAKVCLKFKP